jgi:Flp pilus assembly protein TadB
MQRTNRTEEIDMVGIPAFALVIPVVAIIGAFTVGTVATWADARRKEREAYYKSETLKKIAEAQGGGGQAALEYLREEERIAQRRAQDGRKLGGLIMVAVGAGLMIMLGAILDKSDRGVIFVGAIPFLIGVALLVYSYILGPKEE